MTTLVVGNIKSRTSSTPPTLQDVNGTTCGWVARAWVSFDMNTFGIRQAKNVSSVTDNTTWATINFATAMPNATYGLAVAQSYRLNSGYVQGAQCPYGVYSTTQVGIEPYSGLSAYDNAQFVSVIVFAD